MKVTRKEWEALQARVKELEFLQRQNHRNSLMQVKTGEVLTSVVVPMILEHLKLKMEHGYSSLLPAGASDRDTV